MTLTPEFHVIIPARYNSTRFPGKLLQTIHNESVIQRVYQQALKAKPSSILIATDDERIATHAESFGASVQMTSTKHLTGTDRIAEVIGIIDFPPDSIIVNVQGDEPFIAPELIRQVAQSLTKSSNPIATLCAPLENQDQLLNPNIVKVVRDQKNNALYFSRSPIPLNRDKPNEIEHCFKHIGLYAYRASFLLDFVQWPSCSLEQSEALEQLRVLWMGYGITVEEACTLPLQDINTYEDLILANQFMDSLLTP